MNTFRRPVPAAADAAPAPPSARSVATPRTMAPAVAGRGRRDPAARIGFGAAVALYVGALLGPGVLVLPAIAAAHAGPASLLAWAALVLLSIPIAYTFTALAVFYPANRAGIPGMVGHAFGSRAAIVVGWWFYSAVPLAATTAAMIGGRYVAATLGAGHGVAELTTIGILAVAFAANRAGVQPSGRVQLILVGLLIALLAATVLAAGPHINPAHFHPFAPDGATSVAKATTGLFVGIARWEACANLIGVIDRPRRTLPRVTAVTLAVVGVLYLGLAATTIGVLGPDTATATAPLVTVVRAGLGPAAGAVIAVPALLLTVGASNTYLAGATRLGANLAARGGLPDWLTQRSLAVHAVATSIVAACCAAFNIGTPTLLRGLSVLLASGAVAAMAAGVVLLPRSQAALAALTATAVIAIVLGAAGPALLIPATIGGAAMLWTALGVPPRPPARPAAGDSAPAPAAETAEQSRPTLRHRRDAPAAATVPNPKRAAPAPPRPARRRQRGRRKRKHRPRRAR